jgi:thiazole synthase
MTQVRFNDFAEIIDIALQNQISRDAKLILVGRISYALELGELTFTEAQQLEDKLGGRQQWQEAYEIALSGATENSLYQLPA